MNDMVKDQQLWDRVRELLRFLWREKAENILAIYIGDDNRAIADFFLIASVTSQTHARALEQDLRRFAKSKKFGKPQREVSQNAAWMVLDFGDIVIHLFQPAIRAFYRLERVYEGYPMWVVVDEKELQPVTLRDLQEMKLFTPEFRSPELAK